MKRNRIGVFILVFLLTTGFAAINTYLNLEGSVSLAMKSFSVRFNRAILNGANKTDLFNGDKTSIILQHKDISSQTESTLEYEIKNESLDYDAEATVTCSSSYDNGTSFTYGESSDPIKITVPAGSVGEGSIKVKLGNQETDTSVNKGTLYDALKNGREDYIRTITDTDSGTPIYVYRTASTTDTSNNIIFGEKCWFAIRTTETGGVKLIYNGNPVNGQCLPFGNIKTFGLVPLTKWNELGNDNAYVGYMYGTPGSSTYEETHANINDSSAKKTIDTWYENNLKDTKYASFLEDTVFCNDRSTVSGTTPDGEETTTGIKGTGTVTTDYTKSYTSYKCPNPNDRFTVSSDLGNGSLKYPIATLTRTEVNDAASYLHFYDFEWYTMTPAAYSTGAAMSGRLSGNYKELDVTSSAGIVPVISIKSGTLILKGDGTQQSPFLLETEDISDNSYTCKLEVTPISRTEEAEEDLLKNIKTGDEYCIGDECFWVLSADLENRNLKLFAKNNLYVGRIYTTSSKYTTISNSDVLYGKQSASALGYTPTGEYPWIGGVEYSTKSNVYSSSEAKTYVDNYADYLVSTYGVTVTSRGLITTDELVSLGCDINSRTCKNSWYDWTYGKTYWTMTPATNSTTNVYLVGADGFFGASSYKTLGQRGIRPVITIHVEPVEEEKPDVPVTNRYKLFDTVKNLSKGLDTTNSISYSQKSSVSNGTGVYETTKTDSGKTVYFYRGVVDNNVIFANSCWKIVRTTETEGTKLIYNGKPKQGVCSNTGDDVLIGKSKYSENVSDNAYVGYMYGTAGSTNYDATHANTNDSTIKKAVDKWYEDNILNTEYENAIEDTVYCNDRSLVEAGSNGNNKYSSTSNYASKLGYGTNGTLYGANSRFANNVVTAKPSLVCTLTNDKFSVSTDVGNGALKYPIGLVTADEVSFAGGVIYQTGPAYSNETYYLYGGGSKFFTMSPNWFDSNKRIAIGAVNANDANYNGYYGIELANLVSGVRPVISLKNSVTYTTGTGTEINPYVIDNISDLNAGDIPTSWQDNGVFKNNYLQAYKKLLTMSLDEKIGQLIVAHHSNKATDAITNYNIGGFTYFEADFTGKTEAGVKSMIANEQAASKIPLITAVDEEGGRVVRISPNTSLIADELTKYPNLFYTNTNNKKAWKLSKDLYTESGNNFTLINQEMKVKLGVLKRLGLNVNFAPVVDMAIEGAYISDRVIGLDAAGTAEYAKNVITTSKGTGVSLTMKHFPGYGNNSDTHSSGSVDNKTLTELKNNDMIPFIEGMGVGGEAIMVSHNTVAAIDPDNPSSISKPMHDVLRDDLNFTGVIITDALDMGATKDIANKFAKAINAGNNLILVQDYAAAFNEIKSAVQSGTITQEQVDKLVFRNLAWKYYKGLM